MIFIDYERDFYRENDYTFNRQIMLERNESREEDLAEGRAEGEIRKTIEVICKKANKQNL